MNDDYLINDDYLDNFLASIRKNVTAKNRTDIETLKLLKSLILIGQDFSYKIYDETETNQINLYDFIGYTLTKHFYDENGMDDKEYKLLLKKLFANNTDIEIKQTELIELFEFVNKIKLSNSMKQKLFDLCYYKNIYCKKKFYDEHSNLNLKEEDIKYYNDELINLNKKYDLKYDESKNINLNNEIYENINNKIFMQDYEGLNIINKDNDDASGLDNRGIKR